MLSRISIDLNEENESVIIVDYKQSDDVRDKLVKRFMEKLGTQSSWARIQFRQFDIIDQYVAGSPKLQNVKLMEIKPIGTDKLKEESEIMSSHVLCTQDGIK